MKKLGGTAFSRYVWGMTDDQRAEIGRLAAVAHTASERVRRAGEANVQRDPDAARTQAVEYALWQADAYAARAALETAIAALKPDYGDDIAAIACALLSARQIEPA